MNIISKDEIRLDPERVQVIYTMEDDWGRKIVDSVVLNRPQGEWKQDKEVLTAYENPTKSKEIG